MQKLSLAVICLLACALSFSSCKKYDDEWIKIKSDDFEKRIAALETWQTTANAEIISLQNLIKSINENDFVTKVTPLEDGTGYVISFKKGGDITIKHGEKGAQGDKGDKGEQGEKGEKGDMPVIGTKQDTDGIYYWTMDGEWILDGDKKMPVTGEKGADAIAPRIRIDEDTLEWEISTDGGVTYTPTGIVAKGDKGDSMFSALDNTNEKYVELTLADGETKIQLPRYAEFAISFEIAENETFYASPANNELTLVLPSTLREEDYRSIIAAVTPINGGIVAVKSFNDWKIEITTPEFDENGNVVEGSAKLAVTGNSDSRLSDTYMLRATLVSTDGKEVTATRLIKYFDGVIVESTEELTDNNVARLAWKGEITADDFKYIRENLASSLKILDLSAAEITELPRRALAFNNNNRNLTLEEVVLPEGLITIGNDVFAECAALEKVHFPSTLRTLGGYMFSRCKKLKTLNIPEGVTEIPEKAFYETTGLKSITLPGTVEKIGRSAFYKCESLEEVNMKVNVKEIGESAFSGCVSLRNITIPESVTEIKDSTFHSCINLQFVNLHDNITNLGDYVFYDCESLTGALNRSSVDVKFLKLPKNLQTMGDEVFYHCKNLTGIDMEDTQVTIIPTNTFKKCTNLSEATLPKNLIEIKRGAFALTGLTYIELPKTLTAIRSNAFDSAPLSIVVCHATDAPELGSDVFSEYVKDNGYLHIHTSARESYETKGWIPYFHNVRNI